jgi:hypothetical protein
VFPPWCFHHAARSQTGFPRLSAPTAHADPEVHVRPEACLTSFVPPSGFDHPLGVLLLPDPLDRISGPSAHGVLPFRVFLPPKEPCLFRSLVALLSLTCHRLRRTDVTHDFRALLPPEEPFSLLAWLDANGSRSSPGVYISEAFSLASLLPLRVNSSYALHNHRQPKPLAYAVP